VFPLRYGLNFYILFLRNSGFKPGLNYYYGSTFSLQASYLFAFYSLILSQTYLYQKDEWSLPGEPSKPKLKKKFLAPPPECSVSHYPAHSLSIS
jgi:hypothetical protein